MRPLRRSGAILRCECGRRYPIVDGIPVVLRDLAGWAASEGPSALRRADVDDEVAELLSVDSPSRRNRRLLEVYARAPSSPLSEWVSAAVRATSGPVLELGSGLGNADSVRLDLNFVLLRAGRPSASVVDTPDGAALLAGSALVADAADPPFLAGSFATVVLANVLDSCADPALVLAQADALVAPGGELLVTCAFAFDDTITAPDQQFTPAALTTALKGEAAFGSWWPTCRLTEPPLDLEWRLRLGPRTEHAHSVMVLRARRSG